MTEKLFDHPKTKTHQSHDELLRRILEICESNEFYGVKVNLIENIVRRGLSRG